MCSFKKQPPKEELNRLLVSQTQSFYNISEDIAKGRIPYMAPPFESYQAFKGDIISYCMDFFEKYNGYLSVMEDTEIERVGNEMTTLVKRVSGRKATFDLMKDVHTVERMIVDTLVKCFKGFPSEAVSVFEKRMIANQMHLFELIPQLSVSGVSFFRVRKEDGEALTEGKALFHVPFDKRQYCGTYRYSIPGYPSLYLAKKLDVAKLETDIKEEDIFYAACFRANRILRFIDLSLTQAFETIWERYSLLVFYPLIMACGLTVKMSNAPYKPEYALSQVMSQVFRLHVVEDTFDGFSYISTKVDNPDFMDFNMRNFVLWIKGADEENGYSKSLADSFTVSGPIKCQGDQSTREIEDELMMAPFYPVLGKE